ncbi:hypothetical protein EDC04DRAFT_2598139 [Pisolithus marmoratus]|nr:hypothetical protein EDC04DRAFT_2598139 [Pisolithus marmoratus]
MDVDNEADYQEMVGKVSSIHPSMTKIFVDMKEVERLPLSKSGDESSESSDVGKILKPCLMPGPTDLDTHLSQWHITLQQLHKNECDEGWTYIGPMGPVPLMPAMILDWCCALEEGQATLPTPPNIESFNIANKATYLHPVCKVQVQALAWPTPPAIPSIDINSLALVLLLQTLTKSGILLTSAPATPGVSSALFPVTPTCATTNNILPPLLIPSLSEIESPLCDVHFWSLFYNH